MSRSRDVKKWAESSSIISMTLNRKSRIYSEKIEDDEDLNVQYRSKLMRVIDDFHSDRCQKIVPVITKSLHSSKTFWPWYMMAWDHSGKMILSERKIIIRDRIGIIVRDITIHEFEKHVRWWSERKRRSEVTFEIRNLFIVQSISNGKLMIIFQCSSWQRLSADASMRTYMTSGDNIVPRRTFRRQRWKICIEL